MDQGGLAALVFYVDLRAVVVKKLRKHGAVPIDSREHCCEATVIGGVDIVAEFEAQTKLRPAASIRGIVPSLGVSMGSAPTTTRIFMISTLP
jgi:hypothetical protein